MCAGLEDEGGSALVINKFDACNSQVLLFACLLSYEQGRICIYFTEKPYQVNLA